MRTCKPTSQCRGENIAINSPLPLGGGGAQSSVAAVLSVCDWYVSFLFFFVFQFYRLCVYAKKHGFSFAFQSYKNDIV